MIDEALSVRLREIESWLQKPVTPEEACERLEAEERNVVPRRLLSRIIEDLVFIGTGLFIILVVRRIMTGPPITAAESLQHWVAGRDLSVESLWEYDTAGDSWEYMRGECGYAIVREGKVIDFWMYQIN